MQDPGAGVLGGLDEVGDDVVLGLVLQRAQDIVLVEPVAHRHRRGDGGEFRADVVVDVLVDVEALEGRAGLAGVDEGAPEQVLGDGLGVGVGQDDAGVVAAQFQGQALDGVGGGLDDGLAGGGGAGEHDLADGRVVGQAGADFAAAGDDRAARRRAVPR